MKKNTFYQMHNYVISKNDCGQVKWTTFLRFKGIEYSISGVAEIKKKESIIVLMPIYIEQIMPDGASAEFQSMILEMPIYTATKYYIRFIKLEDYNVRFCSNNKRVEKVKARKIVLSFYPEVLLYKRRILVERIKKYSE